ncbi:ParB/RepB/Spo0J family partition protein [Alysiella filiformis]|uniref:Chromosome partitioning protein, ParB family n=1 Tax=Alysiella filiformis DSM 16848 TaxID=1120981 RepID=A0A286EE70_9NEIS|nr:ParB/RepB/Spo0J family partition protein [Alysiella filiformis]QMT30953.1 ParB/RepB/Spo0J family partition protein [Alysiella filiformis]UBQ56060.1 ParB/RepB/Spo0J family partition protein [Alysiella filiformis DSM 16848]SOD69205.1 chromosome partitioning protein, ParB family [Alysiella filiformis DSM 16848]
MAIKKGGLGRGLDALISHPAASYDEDSGDRLTTLPVSDIRPGKYQARVQIDDAALQELAESIKAQGIIQPVVVREQGGKQYELIAGERRWRAAQLAGLTEVPVVIKNVDDRATMAMGLIENIQRENLNPIEEAQGLRRLIDEFELTHETVAEAIGRSRSAISNSLRLLKLPEPVQDLLFQRHLEMGHARALINLPVNEQLELAQKAVKNGWSVRETEKRSQAIQQHSGSEAMPQKRLDPDLMRLTESLIEQLGVSAEIKTRDRKKGKIILHFDNADAFEDLMLKLGVKWDN